MTTNNTIMKQNRECLQLDIAKKIKIKVDEQARILYVNNYFAEFTGFKVSDIILKGFETILAPSMPKMIQQHLETVAEKFNSFYFIFKGATKNGECFWSLIKVTQRYNANNEFVGYLLEGKMLPVVAIEKINKLFNVLTEIENNAGIEAAKKYFEGFIEEKGMNFNEFILALVEVNDKKLEKYFEIDEDAMSVKKKKRGWF